MNIASPVRNIDNVNKKKMNKIDTNDKHVIHRNEKIKGYDLRMCLASPLRFRPLEKKICAEAPNVKDRLPSPRCDPTLWRLWRGGRRRCKSVSARQKEPPGGQFIGRNMFTRRVVKGFKLFDEGPEKKRKRGKNHNRKCAGVYFLDCEVKAFSIQSTT